MRNCERAWKNRISRPSTVASPASRAAAASALGACFVLLALRVLRDHGERAARRLFGFSILYLFLLFAALMAEQTPGLRLAHVVALWS